MKRHQTGLHPGDAPAAIDVDGPLLLVASSRTVARFAPDWAAVGPRQRGSYRVLVVRDADPEETRQIAAEATSLAAAGIVAIGSDAVLAAAADAAARLRLPLATIPLAAVSG